ncbi:MAG: hypothetical protein L0241_02795 [Planctomycetia bacterium]|nr:hypothetical protein [Planctomycetia bacterium]
MDTQAQTEDSWRSSANPDVLLNAVRPLERVTDKPDAERQRRRAIYDRRYRLFGCACARMVWDLLPTDAQSAVLISARAAYGQASKSDLQAATVRVLLAPVTFQEHALCAAGWASTAVYSPQFQPTQDESGWNPHEAARVAAKSLATRAAGPAPPGRPTTAAWETAWNQAFASARAHQAELVRDIFPPPGDAIRSTRLERDWLTSTVLTLARQADETGEYSALPILADALQDAGCDNEFMLARCRAFPPIHCLGNWVVDLLLGRE